MTGARRGSARSGGQRDIGQCHTFEKPQQRMDGPYGGLLDKVLLVVEGERDPEHAEDERDDDLVRRPGVGNTSPGERENLFGDKMIDGQLSDPKQKFDREGRTVEVEAAMRIPLPIQSILRSLSLRGSFGTLSLRKKKTNTRATALNGAFI